MIFQNKVLKKVFIIAEAGVNHNGIIKLAFKLIDNAFQAGVDAVKFQTAVPEAVVSKFAPKAEYQIKTTGGNQSQLDMIKNLVFNIEEHKELLAYCKYRNIIFLSSPFDLESIDLLDQLGLDLIKIPSGEITNMPYLRKIGQLNKEVIMSTGMANLYEVKHALDILVSSGMEKENIAVLHCNTEYPTPFEDVNLRAMLTIRDKLRVRVGYSDHTLGIEVPVAAVSLGAEVIEKHFTLDRNMEGPDHKASLEPDELKAMVQAIRNIEKALGDVVKRPSKSETKNIVAARKSIVAAKGIQKSETFTEGNITVKRPGSGISPMRWDEVLGQPAKRNFSVDELIEL